jgi:hypothetical protein
MAVISIVATDMVAQQVHAEALKENRTLSAMGQILLRESLERRRAEKMQVAEVARLAAVIRGETATP